MKFNLLGIFLLLAVSLQSQACPDDRVRRCLNPFAYRYKLSYGEDPNQT